MSTVNLEMSTFEERQMERSKHKTFYLHLSQKERKDLLSLDRYLCSLLYLSEWNPQDIDRDSVWNITFLLTEKEVVKLQKIGEKNNYQWPNLPRTLAEKFNNFIFESFHTMFADEE